MALVVGDAEFLLDDLGDAGAGPDLAAKAVSFRPVPKEVGDEADLSRFEFGGVAGGRTRQQHGRAIVTGLGQSLADSRPGDIQGGSDVSLLPAELLQAPSLHPPPLPPVSRVQVFEVHARL